MKKIKVITVSALAGIGAAQVLRWLDLGIVHILLMSPGAWSVEQAAKAAPWILAALISGAAISLYGMWAENQQYKHSARRQRESLTVAQEQRNDARRDA